MIESESVRQNGRPSTQEHTQENKMTISEERQAYLQREREESFAGKTKTKLQLSLRTHRGQLTKLLGVMEGCTESLEAIPSSRCADELEDLKDKSFAKVEDIEYGYNVLIALDPEAEKEYRDFIKSCVDKYVAQVKRAQKALGKATPAAPKPTASKNTDTVKIREGLKPEKLKLDYTPQEYRAWVAEIKTFFTASNLKYAETTVQRGYLRMCISSELVYRLQEHAEIHEESPVMEYDDEEVEELTCLEAIDNEFLDKYPLTSRRYEVMQLRQPRGTPMTEYCDKLAAMCKGADMLAIQPDELIATMMIIGCTDEEMKGELMKIENPTQKKVKEEAKAQERKRANMKRTTDVQKAYVANAKKDKASKKKEEKKSEKLLCWSCGNDGHRSRDCSRKKEELFCKKCKKQGHVAKVCKGGSQKKGGQARQAKEKEDESSSSDSETEEVKTTRVGASTPPFLL